MVHWSQHRATQRPIVGLVCQKNEGEVVRRSRSRIQTVFSPHAHRALDLVNSRRLSERRIAIEVKLAPPRQNARSLEVGDRLDKTQRSFTRR